MRKLLTIIPKTTAITFAFSCLVFYFLIKLWFIVNKNSLALDALQQNAFEKNEINNNTLQIYEKTFGSILSSVDTSISLIVGGIAIFSLFGIFLSFFNIYLEICKKLLKIQKILKMNLKL